MARAPRREAGGTAARAQQAGRAESNAPAAFPGEQLEHLVAPIALCGDELLAHVLTASTYPRRSVVAAARWLQKVPGLQDDALDAALQQQDWAPSIESPRAPVEAQREFAERSGADGGRGAYARRVLGSPGRRDGLDGPAAEGEPESPLGPLIAEAFAEGYRAGEPIPDHGKCYRLPTVQGSHAPCGARSHLDGDRRLVSGFAALAWPATWDHSGVITIQVDRCGIVSERDLGSETAQRVDQLQAFDPDLDWAPVQD